MINLKYKVEQVIDLPNLLGLLLAAIFKIFSKLLSLIPIHAFYHLTCC